MNCKQGDMAVIVRSQAGWNGIIVKCVRYIGADIWSIEPKFKNGQKFDMCLDSILCPIRDSDKQDEMLSIVSLKEGEPA